MGDVIYVVDTNVISDLLKKNTTVIAQMREKQSNVIILCQAVDYEVRRGLLHKQATSQLGEYETRIRPQFQWLSLTDADWQQAAQFWAEMRRKGRQLADTDLLIAAVTYRINGIIVTADDDFDALPIQRENWRIT